jgi:hypothetical protein
MNDTLYQTELFGVVKIVGRDMTGRVLIEATERKTNRPEWPRTIEPGFRQWISQFAVGAPLSSQGNSGGGQS